MVEDNAAKPISKKRKVLFKTIGILLPLLVLCLIEVSLRVFGYGHDLTLFVEYGGDKNFLVLNPNASRRYFSNQSIATTGNSEIFKKEKDSNTIRIFVLGESTTIGYPYFHNGSFHRWLQYRLMHTFPDKNFEIINLSLTAVNSYTVAGFAQEVVNYQPDAVLIYTGHNEYYGALGVGSTNTIAGNRGIVKLVLYLRGFRTVQLLTNLYEKMASHGEKDPQTAGVTRMKMMVAQQQIPMGSSLYKRGIEQFSANMDETLSLFNSKHILVFISNLVSNEKDLQPFINVPPDRLNSAGFNKYYTAGLEAFKNNDSLAALANLKQANQVYGMHALCNYYLGQLAYNKGDFTTAKEYFSKARDLDALRFRAPAQNNEVITALCNKYPVAHLVDTKSAFEAYSDNHIIGNWLILEHVHPNLKGYAILSDAFYEAMKKANFITVNKQNEISFAQLLATMPITAIDSLTGVYRISNIKNSWPFNERPRKDSVVPTSVEEQLAYGVTYKRIGWDEAMDKLYRYYVENKELAKAKTITEGLVLENPSDGRFYEKAAMVCGQLNDYESTIFYLAKAFALSPSFDKARTLFVLYLKLDQPAGAMPYLDYAINNNSAGMNLAPIKPIAEEIIQLQQQYVRDTSATLVLNKIAADYFKMGNRDGASRYVDKILKKNHNNKGALEMLAVLNKPH
jgi:tetratricopeptide (TPR) repeat protein